MPTHRIPVKKMFKDHRTEINEMRFKYNHAVEGSLVKEMLSIDPRKFRGKKMRKLYAKAQDAMAELGDYLNNPVKSSKK